MATIDESSGTCKGIETSLIKVGETESAGNVHTWDICGVWTSHNFVDAMANGTLFYQSGSSQGQAITMNNSTGGAGFHNQSVSGFFPIYTNHPNLSQLYPFTLSHFNNPLNPLYNATYEAWYDYVVSQLGPINIGDTVVVDNEPYGYPLLNPFFSQVSCTHPGIPVFHVEKICLVYKGLHYLPMPWNIAHMTLGDPNFIPIPSGTPMPGFDIYRGPCCNGFPKNKECKIISYDFMQGPGNDELRYFPNIGALSGLGTVLANETQIYNMLPTNITNPQLSEGIAYYDNKIWMTISYNSTSSSFTGVVNPNQSYKGILELNLSPNHTVSFSRIINIPQGNPGDFEVRCSYNSTELLVSYHYFPNFPSFSHGQTHLFHFDISTTTANITPLFSTQSMVADAIYIPQSNTYVTTEKLAGMTRHYDAQGNLLGSASISDHSVFCSNGNIYLADATTHEMNRLDIATMSLHPLPNSGTNLSDVGTNPECCNTSPDYPAITSWDCVQIGDHPKFGFKCIEVAGPAGPLGGQYATKQECIDSGCKEIDPDPGGITSNIGQIGPSPITGGTGGAGGSTGSQSASKPGETGGTGESPSGGRDSSYGG
tara:strand:+ start:569 stop:2359 length:1791 start_codon:yes stop_codon:yes gene_type:complete